MSRARRQREPAGPALPAGYVRVRSPDAAWVARNECADLVRRGDADRIFRKIARSLRPPGGGRGPLHRFRLGDVEVIAKRAVHGGALAGLLRGLYLGTGRLTDQIRLADRLERAGVATPGIVAVGWRRVLGPVMEHAVVTRFIPRSQNLYEAAAEDAPWRRRRATLSRSAEVVRAMHDAGFVHADLNVTNLLLGEGPEGDRVYVVDLDRGRFRRHVGESTRFGNLARLLRSYEKWIAGRFRLSPREEMRFLRSYCRSDSAELRSFQTRLQRYRSRLGVRRRLWKTGRPPSLERDANRPGSPE